MLKIKFGIAVGLLAVGTVFGQGSGAFVVQASQPLFAGLAAFPRIVAGEGATPEVAARVNAALARQDTLVAGAAAVCRKTAQKAERHADPKAWQRTMQVTMAGPRYVSLLATDADDCGRTEPHSAVVLPLVYDLTTGALVNWAKLMPDGVRASVATAEDGTQMGVVEWPVLQAMAVKQATAECRESIRENGILDFALWLDGAKGTLIAQTVSFPNAGAACEVPLTFTVEQMRQLGFAKALVDELEIAKAAAPAVK